MILHCRIPAKIPTPQSFSFAWWRHQRSHLNVNNRRQLTDVFAFWCFSSLILRSPNDLIVTNFVNVGESTRGHVVWVYGNVKHSTRLDIFSQRSRGMWGTIVVQTFPLWIALDNLRHNISETVRPRSKEPNDRWDNRLASPTVDYVSQPDVVFPFNQLLSRCTCEINYWPHISITVHPRAKRTTHSNRPPTYGNY